MLSYFFHEMPLRIHRCIDSVGVSFVLVLKTMNNLKVTRGH